MTKKRRELLGCKVRDVVTGFKGIAVSKHSYLNGCVRYYVIPQMKKKEREMPKGNTVDIEQLEYIDVGVSGKISAEPSGVGDRCIPNRV